MIFPDWVSTATVPERTKVAVDPAWLDDWSGRSVTVDRVNGVRLINREERDIVPDLSAGEIDLDQAKFDSSSDLPHLLFLGINLGQELFLLFLILRHNLQSGGHPYLAVHHDRGGPALARNGSFPFDVVRLRPASRHVGSSASTVPVGSAKLRPVLGGSDSVPPNEGEDRD